MEEILGFIDDLYQTMNIYLSVIIHDNTRDVDSLKKRLIERDYPVTICRSEEDIDYNKCRMFIMDLAMFEKWVDRLHDTTVVICLGVDINNKITRERTNKLYIFSCNK